MLCHGTAEARRLLAEALALTHQYGGHFYEAEVYRLTGEILLMQDAGGGISEGLPPDPSMVDEHESEATGQSPRQAEAEAWFRQALDVARRQQTKSLELRAAMSLSRLWQKQDKRTEAYQLLAPVYGWFTEGYDTADLQEAKVLLDALACHGSGGRTAVCDNLVHSSSHADISIPASERISLKACPKSLCSPIHKGGQGGILPVVARTDVPLSYDSI
jgi:hypothetical protein